MNRILRRLLATVALATLALVARPAAGPDEWLAAAEAKQLWTNRYWLTLGHYQGSLFGAKSLIDDPAFFLAPNGKTDPRAELLATLQAFFAPIGTNEKAHAIYRFPARLHWLQQELGWDGTGLERRESERLRQVYDYLKPTTVAMIYPAAYMNSPASMFGHTMIVFDAKDKNRLLSQAVTYAAYTPGGFGPLFAVEGVFGFYRGYYSAMPYYDKVEEYTAVGHRDVWEYELNFTQEEVDQMFRHAWELQNIFSYYYFFDENCSYNLFYLLDAARPSLHTTDYGRPFVVPIDTVKYIDRLGLVRGKTYRPSQVSRIRHLSRELDTPTRQLALSVAQGRTNVAALAAAVTNRADLVRAMDFTAEYTQYLYADEKLPPDQYRPRFLQILRARSALGKGAEVPDDAPVPTHPEDGHGPGRLTVGAGVSANDGYALLRLRPAYHGLTDDDEGFTRGATIEFLNLELRGYPSRRRVELQNIDLVEVNSLAPRDALFHPSSWRVRVGLTQSERVRGQDRRMGVVETASGLTWKTGDDGLFYVAAAAQGALGRDFDDGYGIGAGPAAGLVQNITRSWKCVAQARAIYTALGDEFWDQRYNLDQNVALNRDVSLGLGIAWLRVDQNDQTEFTLRLNRYF